MMNSTARQEVSMMLHEWKEEVDLRAFGAVCPMPGCESLVITYEAPNSLNEIACGGNREFICPECGVEFVAPRSDLLFQAVPREWLFSKICNA